MFKFCNRNTTIKIAAVLIEHYKTCNNRYLIHESTPTLKIAQLSCTDNIQPELQV